MTANLIKLNSEVWGPEVTEDTIAPVYAYVHRSTYSGCRLLSTDEAPADLDWPNGWFDPCFIGAWDLIGRTFKDVNGNKYLENLEAFKVTEYSNNLANISR